MSLPSMLICCSACSYKASDAMTWGVREYVLANGVRITANRELGWCHDCKGIAPVENLDTRECTTDILEAEAVLHEAPPSKPAPAKFWQISRWFATDSYTDDFAEWQRRQERAREKLADSRDLLAMLRDRESPARCLSCGSERVIAPLSETDTAYPEEGGRTPLGFIHPDCGGELFLSNEGLRIAIRQTVSRYTPEGDFLDKSDLESYSTPSASYFDLRRSTNAQRRQHYSTKT